MHLEDVPAESFPTRDGLESMGADAESDPAAPSFRQDQDELVRLGYFFCRCFAQRVFCAARIPASPAADNRRLARIGIGAFALVVLVPRTLLHLAR